MRDASVLRIEGIMLRFPLTLPIANTEIPKAAPYEIDLLGDTYCSVESRATRSLILAWHFGGRSAHDVRLFAEKLRTPRFFADRTTHMGFRACISHELP